MNLTTNLSSIWIAPIIKGVLAIILAFVLFIHGSGSTLFFISLLGIFVFVTSLLNLMEYFSEPAFGEKGKKTIKQPLIQLVLGLVMIIFPPVVGYFFVYVISGIVLCYSFFSLIYLWRTRLNQEKSGNRILWQILILLCAIVAIISPELTLSIISYLVASIALIFGVIAIRFGFYLKARIKASHEKVL